jgi:hypothetical protein
MDKILLEKNKTEKEYLMIFTTNNNKEKNYEIFEKIDKGEYFTNLFNNFKINLEYKTEGYSIGLLYEEKDNETLENVIRRWNVDTMKKGLTKRADGALKSITDYIYCVKGDKKLNDELIFRLKRGFKNKSRADFKGFIERTVIRFQKELFKEQINLFNKNLTKKLKEVK